MNESDARTLRRLLKERDLVTSSLCDLELRRLEDVTPADEKLMGGELARARRHYHVETQLSIRLSLLEHQIKVFEGRVEAEAVA